MKRIVLLIFLTAFIRPAFDGLEVPQTPQEYELQVKKEKSKKPKK